VYHVCDSIPLRVLDDLLLQVVMEFSIPGEAVETTPSLPFDPRAQTPHHFCRYFYYICASRMGNYYYNLLLEWARYSFFSSEQFTAGVSHSFVEHDLARPVQKPKSHWWNLLLLTQISNPISVSTVQRPFLRDKTNLCFDEHGSLALLFQNGAVS
jgi:hypothetical protein